MSTRRFVLILPSLIPTGPVKGAIAMADGLVNKGYKVTIIALKKPVKQRVEILPEVEILDVSDNSWLQKMPKVKELMKKYSQTDELFYISYAFSADVFNYLLTRGRSSFVSVRGDLFQNYRFDYGRVIGISLAKVHYFFIKRFPIVISMSDAMTDQLQALGVKKQILIPNFIDEIIVEKHREAHKQVNKSINFGFLASLSSRKRPELLLEIFHEFHKKNYNFKMNFYGDGPLRASLEKLNQKFGTQGKVIFHGHVEDPYSKIQKNDYIILPSESEGVPRAIMESLYLGVPCVLRDVDANSELVKNGTNGFVFKNDEDLKKVLEEIITDKKKVNVSSSSLLLPKFQQNESIKRLEGYIYGH